MTDEATSPSVETSFLHAVPPDAPPAPVALEPAEPPESRTRGMLREAIQQVMEQITHHENEAKRHLQQAKELRRELQESFAFAQQEGGGRSKPAADAAAVPTADPAGKARPRDEAADDRPARAPKKKPAGKKSK